MIPIGDLISVLSNELRYVPDILLFSSNGYYVAHIDNGYKPLTVDQLSTWLTETFSDDCRMELRSITRSCDREGAVATITVNVTSNDALSIRIRGDSNVSATC